MKSAPSALSAACGAFKMTRRLARAQAGGMIWLWIGFIVFIAIMITLDLGVINRSARVVNTGRAMAFSAACVVLALLFTVAVYFIYDNHWLGMGIEQGTLLPKNGAEAAGMFLAGWLVE